MDDNKEIPNKLEPIKGEILTTSGTPESFFCNISIRAWVCIILVLAVVTYPFFKISSDIVNNLCISVISFYFGKMQSNK